MQTTFDVSHDEAEARYFVQTTRAHTGPCREHTVSPTTSHPPGHTTKAPRLTWKPLSITVPVPCLQKSSEVSMVMVELVISSSDTEEPL